MATPKKRGKAWRCMVYGGKDTDGKRIYISVTAPTKAECAYKAAQIQAAGPAPPEPVVQTVGEVVDRYIENCEATLSPTTVAGYKKTRRTRFPDLMRTPVSALSSESVQRAINAEMTRETERRYNLSGKTIKNAYGLISAALRHVCGLTFDVKLPKAAPRFLELPEPAAVMAAISGTEIELPCMLALWLSLSMSEVRGLKYSSIRHGCLYIDQVVVDVDGRPVEKAQAKTESRNRFLALPPELLALIRDRTDFDAYKRGEIPDGFLWPYSHDKIRHGLEKTGLGITFHQLRHLNASVMLRLGVPDKYAMERGGWSTPAVMKSVYQHTMSSERLRVDASVDAFFRDALKNATMKCNHEAQKP